MGIKLKNVWECFWWCALMLPLVSCSVPIIPDSTISMSISDICYSHSDCFDFEYDCFDITLCCRYNTNQTFKVCH